jgi:hypothetical protein
MNNLVSLIAKYQKLFLALCIVFLSAMQVIVPAQGLAQKPKEAKLEKMPMDLERDYALSSLPPHLRKGAAVYLLDPAKGYYMVQKGTNGFVCLVIRMEWEWGEFRNDYTMPISFDAAGAKAIFPIYQDVAAMRASGKFTAKQIKETVISRINKGIYKVPARPGISYMLEPIMRGYPGNPNNNKVMTMSMPHIMFYAPYMNDADIGGDPANGPSVGNPDNTVFGDKKGPFGYIIVPAGETEAAKIIKANSDLIKRLVAYKAYYKI